MVIAEPLLTNSNDVQQLNHIIGKVEGRSQLSDFTSWKLCCLFLFL